MKVILRILFLVILLLVAIPSAIVGAALINDAPVPTYMRNFDQTQFNAEAEINKKLEMVMMSNVLGNKNIKVNEEFVAKFLYASTNGFAAMKSQLSDNYKIGVEYIWFTFDDNILSMYGTVALNETRTTFTAKLEFKDFQGYTEIKVHTLKIGKLPISKSLVVWGIEKLNDGKQDLKKINPYGQFKLDELTITVEDEHINNMFKNALKSDLIQFKSITFNNKDFTLNYDFSSTPEATAMNLALQDINNIVKNKKDNITTEVNKLDIDASTKTSIDSVLSMLETKLDTKTDFTFTEEDMTKITELTNNFKNLTPEQANQISDIFINQFDNKAAIEEALKNSSTDLNKLINEFLGKK